MATGIFFEFVALPATILVALLVLGATLVLPLARVPLLKSYWQSATTVLPSCACHLAHFQTKDLYSKGGCARIATLGQPPASRV